MLRCADNTLYTGITTDVDRRMSAHRGELPGGAKYLRGRSPFEVVFTTEAGDKSAASKLERKIKRLPREKKEALIKNREMIEGLVETTEP